MEGQQVLVEADRLQRRRIGVGNLRLPRQEFVHRAENRAVGGKIERILGPGRTLLTGSIEIEGVEGEEVEHRGPVATRRRSLLQQIVVNGYGRSLELLFAGERFAELLINLA